MNINDLIEILFRIGPFYAKSIISSLWLFNTLTLKKLLIMSTSTQWDNPTHTNKAIERQKALAVLEKAKMLNRKVVFLPKGASGSLKQNSLF